RARRWSSRPCPTANGRAHGGAVGRARLFGNRHRRAARRRRDLRPFEEDQMKLLTLATTAMLSLAALTQTAAAQEAAYPNDIVRIVVGSSPGGTADTVSRLIAEGLTAKFG